MSKAKAEIEITASDSKLAAGLARARTKVNEWAAAAARGIGKAMSKIYEQPKPKSRMRSKGQPEAVDDDVDRRGKKRKSSLMGNAFSFAAGEAISQGVSGIADAAQGVRNFERALVRYQIVANKTPESMRAFRDQVRQVSKDTGVSSDEVLAGAQAYVDITGDVDGASASMRGFARIAQASDSSMADIANAAASMQDAMHIKPEEMEAVFSGLINQGKAGAVTLKNMAGEFPSLLSKFARFGVLGRNGTIELGAMYQVTRKGFGSAEEAGTGLQAMMTGLVKHADRFAKAGVNVFNIGKDGTKTLKPMSEIIDQIGKSKLAKDPQLLNKAFGRGEGEQAYQMLKGHVDMLHQMEQAGQDAGTVERDLATFAGSDAGRMDVAFNKLKVTIAEAFTPERITGFVNAVTQLADKLGVIGDVIGAVGDKLGAVFNAGRAIRGSFSQDDPFRVSGNYLAGKMTEIRDEEDPAKRKRLQQGFDQSLRDSGAYTAARDNILGGEINERSSPESLKRALYARFSDRGNGQGVLGESYAGQVYLKNAGVQGQTAQLDKLNEYVTTLVKAQTEAITKALRDGMASAPAPVTKIGDNQIAKSHQQATHARRGP